MAEDSGVGVGCHSEGRRPEESGVKAFQKQNQILHSAQNDNQNQVLRWRSGRQSGCHPERCFTARRIWGESTLKARPDPSCVQVDSQIE